VNLKLLVRFSGCIRPKKKAENANISCVETKKVLGWQACRQKSFSVALVAMGLTEVDVQAV